MSIGGMARSYDLDARSQEADLLQARYFYRMLVAQRDELTADIRGHTALFSHAELAHDAWRMQYERRQIRTLEGEEQQITLMLDAIEQKFHRVASE